MLERRTSGECLLVSHLSGQDALRAFWKTSNAAAPHPPPRTIRGAGPADTYFTNRRLIPSVADCRWSPSRSVFIRRSRCSNVRLKNARAPDGPAGTSGESMQSIRGLQIKSFVAAMSDEPNASGKAETRRGSFYRVDAASSMARAAENFPASRRTRSAGFFARTILPSANCFLSSPQLISACSASSADS